MFLHCPGKRLWGLGVQGQVRFHLWGEWMDGWMEGTVGVHRYQSHCVPLCLTAAE